MRISLLLAASAAVLLAACSPAEDKLTAGDDFFQYAHGEWLKTFTIPADKARYGAFDELGEKSENDVKTILDGFATSPPAAGTNVAKAADMYASWMDEAAIDARGVEPLKPYIDKINAVRNKAELTKLITGIYYATPFGLGIEADPADPTRYSIWATQGGIGMPDRDYYLEAGEKFESYRTAYKAYVTKIFELLGDTNPAASADTVITFETEIAKGHWPQKDLRNPDIAYKTMALADFKALVPNVDWDKYFVDAGLPKPTVVVAYGDTAVAAGAKLLDSTPIDTWKKYLTFHIASDNASHLSKAFDDAQFGFFSKTLRGIEAKRDRWKRGVTLLDQNIGEAVGEAYVAKFFPPDNKAKMDALVANLRTALEGRLKESAWMDDATKTQALAKLATFEPRIGYPSKWRDYSAMVIEKGKHFENIMNARQFEFNRQVARLDQPVDRAEWGMNAQTVNASYNPLMNQITFPAGILQPPFFDPNADAAVNYGAIGAVIGHEIGHGFDDQGRAFDEKGVLRNWWSEATDAKFKEAAGKLGAQYAKYCPVENGCINPELTMGENIGDLGGLNMAYTAYKLSLGGKEAPVIDGKTGDQRFFLSWAEVWRSLGREDDTRARLVTDPHSMPKYRVNGVVRNMDAWYAAFGVKEGDDLYLKPEDRVHIW